MVHLDHQVLHFVVGRNQGIALAVTVGCFDQEPQFQEQLERFGHLGRCHESTKFFRNQIGNGAEILEPYHFKNYGVVPFLENTELSLVHLVQLGTGACLDELGVVDLLVGVGLSLVKEYEAFEVGGALVFETQAMNKLGDRIFGDVALAVDCEL